MSEFPSLVWDLGGPLGEILEDAGLSLEQIEQPTLLIPFDKHIRLLEVAAQRCACEEFALELAKRQDMAVFGALSILVVQANTVRQGLQMFGRYLHYGVQAVRLDMREATSTVTESRAMLRKGMPEEIAAMVCHLCQPIGRYVTGQTIHVNGGMLFTGA